MKRSRTATHLFKRQTKNRAFFQNYRTFTLIQDPRGRPRARQRSANSTPGATRMCESPGVARGVGWSGLELTDTLRRQFVCVLFFSLGSFYYSYCRLWSSCPVNWKQSSFLYLLISNNGYQCILMTTVLSSYRPASDGAKCHQRRSLTPL